MTAASPAFRSAAGVVWLKDDGGTLLVQQGTGQTWALRGLEAAVWDLLVLGYSFEGAARLLRLLAGMAEDEAQASLLAMLQRWNEAGILVMERGNGRDQSGH